MAEVEIVAYAVPITGTVLNWETFSGDPNDPVRPVIPEVVGPILSRLKEINVDEGSAIVEIETTAAIHLQIQDALRGKLVAQYAKERGISHLKRPAGAPMPVVSLSFSKGNG